MQPVLEIKDLTVGFGAKPDLVTAVNNISLNVGKGEILAIVGESGSGKSVTALSVLQLLPQKQTHYPSGEIIFNGNDLLHFDEKNLRKIRGNKIAMIFQEPMTSLNPVYTCGEQVMEILCEHKDLSKDEARAQTIILFRKVQLPEPENILSRYPHQLSGGQKQRVMIAMAISCEPELLIADEPTTALDVTVQKTVIELLKQLQAQTGMGMIFITHDLGLVKEIAHKVVVMYRGQVLEEQTVDGIFNTPRHPYTKALLACRPILHPKGKRLPVVKDFWSEEIHPTGKHPMGDATFLKVQNLEVCFVARKNLFGKPLSYFKAIDNLGFDLKQGETLGVVGESGSGKTTLGRAILGLVPVSAGQILYKGRNLAHFGRKEMNILRKEIQVVFQDPYGSLNPRLTIGNAITEAMSVHGIGGGSREREELVVHLLEKVNLKADHFSRYPHAFSGGQRQRIGIARALSLNPGLIIFDESVSALDVSIQAQVLNLINDLKAEFGFTAIFISHDLGVVKYISDRILVLNKGQIEEIGPAEQVFNTPASPYTRRLIDSIPGIL